MSWRDRLRPAVFRGATFFVDSAEFEGGQRLRAHEFPQRQLPLVEWLGRKVRSYRFAGYLIGDDYMTQRDRLIKAAESVPGGFPVRVGSTLIHPFLGELRVVLQSVRVKETRLEGRMARVDLVFLEAGREPIPIRTNGQFAAKATDAKDAAEEAAAADLVENLEVAGVPQEVRDGIAGELSALGTKLQTLGDVFTGPAKDVAALQSQAVSLVNQAAALAVAPATLATTVQTAVDAVLAAAGNALGAFTAYEVLLGLQPTKSSLTGGTATKANEAVQKTNDFVHVSVVAGATEAAVSADFPTLEEAQAARKTVTDELDLLLERVLDDVYPALQEVRSIAAQAIPLPGSDLPSILTLTLPGTVPALLLANRLYDTATREAEIVDRNRIRHPLFVPGLEPLGVLSA